MVISHHNRSPLFVEAPLHEVTQKPLTDVPPSFAIAYFGMGCFWGAERLFWQQMGVYVTAVGYCGGSLEHPTYSEVCGGETGHAEVVRVVFDPQQITYEQLLHCFWTHHDPTQGLRQGFDVGSQYRSVIYTTDETQYQQAIASKIAYQALLEHAGHPQPITTEIAPALPFYYAEGDHQQYLHKHPEGYCGLGGIDLCRS